MSGLLAKPKLGPNTVDLWPYQQQAKQAVFDKFHGGEQATLLIMPTGTGKTITFGAIARAVIEDGGRVLILAHTDELCQQAVGKLDHLGVQAELEKAHLYARSLYDPDAVVACVPTLRPKRLLTWPKDYFRLIITDEAHHAIADSYQRIYAHFGKAWHLGVTATPDRGDDESLMQVYQSVAFETTIQEMVAAEPDPFLAMPYFVPKDLGINLRDIRRKSGDFSAQDLANRIEPHLTMLCNFVRESYQGRKTILFVPHIDTANAMAAGLRSLGLNFDYIYGDDPDREIKIQKARDGEIDGLVNSMLLKEGFDWPECSCVGIFKITTNRGLMAQMIGRGLRRGKPDCLVLFPWTPGELAKDAVHPVEIMDATWIDPETIKIAIEEVGETDKPVSMLEAVEKAETTRKKREAVQIQIAERKIGGRSIKYSPFDAFRLAGMPWRGPREATVNLASPGQVALLAKFGIDCGPGISKTRASTMIDYLLNARKEGRPTIKQIGIMVSDGGLAPEDARKMSREEASEIIGGIFAKRGWGK